MQRSLSGLLIGAVVGLLMSLATLTDVLPAFHRRLGDILTVSSGEKVPVAVIAVDEPALWLYGRPEEWSADRYAVLFQRLGEAGARVLALDVLVPPEVVASLPITPGEFIVWPVLGAGTPTPAPGWLVYPYGVHRAPLNGAVGHINLVPDPDGVLRRVPLWVQAGESIAPALAWRAVALYLQEDVSPPTRSPFRWFTSTLAPDGVGRVRFQYLALPAIPTYPMRDVMSGNVPPEALAGRILFLGVTGGEGVEIYRTPLGNLSAVEVQARIAAAFLTGRVMASVSPSLTVSFILAVTLLSGWLAARVRPPILIPALLVVVACGAMGVVWALGERGQMMEPFPVLLGWLLSAAVVAVWRTHYERQRRGRFLGLLRGWASSRLLAYLAEEPEMERILATDVRFIAVLFADVRGFVRLTEGQDPRMVREAAHEHLSAFTDAVVKSGGMVTKYVGDMVAAIFNAPLPIERPVDQALRAAQEGQRRLRELWREKPQMLRMPMGVGIHAGTAVVGLMGSSQHPEYDAIGDTVNVAARLSTYAPAGEIYVTEAVVASAGKGWLFEPLGVVQLRGRNDPVMVYRLKVER